MSKDRMQMNLPDPHRYVQMFSLSLSQDADKPTGKSKCSLYLSQDADEPPKYSLVSPNVLSLTGSRWTSQTLAGKSKYSLSDSLHTASIVMLKNTHVIIKLDYSCSVY